MSRAIPNLPAVSAEDAPTPDDPGYSEWLERVAISPEGVDRMQLWESLQWTPAQRLAELERVVNDLLELRGGRRPEIP